MKRQHRFWDIAVRVGYASIQTHSLHEALQMTAERWHVLLITSCGCARWIPVSFCHAEMKRRNRQRGEKAGHLRYILIASVTRRASGCWWRRQTRAWSSWAERRRREWLMDEGRFSVGPVPLSCCLHRDGLCSNISLKNNYYYARTFMPKDNQRWA